MEELTSDPIEDEADHATGAVSSSDAGETLPGRTAGRQARSVNAPNESAPGKGASKTPTAAPAPPKRVGAAGWVIAVLVVLILLGLTMTGGRQAGEKKPSGQEKSTPAEEEQKSKMAKYEAAREVALEAVRRGRSLSAWINKAPKLENVLSAAQKLQELSPRYQPQVDSAQNTLNAALKEQDKSLMAYIDRVIQLSSYPREQISYCLKMMEDGDQTPREKIVTELLTEHLKSLQKGAKPDSSSWLADFTRRFANFVD
jgi:hypothetical protein